MNLLQKHIRRTTIGFMFIVLTIIAIPNQIYANANDPQATGDPTRCPGTVVSFGVLKQLLPIKPSPQSGRDGSCITPHTIVMHITQTGYTTAQQTYNDFYNNYDGRGAASHFVIGKTGDTIQMVESLDKTFEYAAAVGGYGDDISIELTSLNILNGKNDIPQAEYNAALTLVQALMKQYNIPLGPHDYTWLDTQFPDGGDPNLAPGIYGHYQLNLPPRRTDPGEGFMRDFRQDLANGTVPNQGTITATSNCVITKIGNPAHPPTIPPECAGSQVSACPDPLPQNASIDSVKSTVLTKYGINLTGSISLPRAEDVYNTMCLLSQSSKYMSLLGSQNNTIQVDTQSPDACGGQRMSNNLINIYGWCGDLSYANRLLLVHEFGHVLDNKNPSLYNSFLNTVYGDPTNPHTIPVHNCLWDYDRFGQVGPYPHECFSDMIGEYLVYKNWRVVFAQAPDPLGPSDPYNPNGPLDRTFPEYATDPHYANYYSFAKTNIFGGVEYEK